MQEREVVETLRSIGAIEDGHFVYISGAHGSQYINKDVLLQHPHVTSQLCRALAERFANCDVDVVVGPAMGGIILAHWVAYHLADITGREVLSAYAERDSDRQLIFKRGYDERIRGRKVLAIDDILHKGTSARELIALLRVCGADVVGFGAVCSRGAPLARRDIGDPASLVTLAHLDLPSWEVDECPLCKEGVLISTHLGHGQ